MKPKHYLAATLLATAAVAFAIACGDGDDDGATPTAPSGTPTADAPAASPTPRSTPTAEAGGVAPVVQQAIDLVLAGDYLSVEELFVYQMVACAVDVMGAGGPPECEADEADGTEVEVLPVSQCEGAYLRPQDVFLAQRMRDQESALYAVYNAATADIFPAGDYAVVFSYVRPAMPDTTLTLELLMSDAGVVGVNFACGEDPATLVSEQGLTEAIVAPE
jgi:hypothetical protein